VRQSEGTKERTGTSPHVDEGFVRRATSPARGRVVGDGFHERVYAVVLRVPIGFVTTYGDVAEALGSRSVARHVGFALAALPPRRREVPWHRVVGAGGRLTLESAGAQRKRLVREGVAIVATKAGERVAEFKLVRAPVAALRGRNASS
jgi:methylated-DNA-protein-cysteine methyltransferase related protein